MKRTFPTILGVAFCLLSLTPRNKETWTPLLDKNLSQWNMYLSYRHKDGYKGAQPVDDKGIAIKPIGYNKNEANVFSIIEVNGETILHISGEIYGCVYTKQEFQNYHLKLKVKWGKKKWTPRLSEDMDSGILYNSQGECGVDYWRAWMLGQEFQVCEKSFGDFWCIASSQIDIRAAKPAGKDTFMFNPKADIISFGQPGQNGGYCQRSTDMEKPKGEWNEIDLISFGDKSLHIVNGQVVMALSNSRYWDGKKSIPLTKGKIQLQSEAAEVFYKDIQISQLTKLPTQYAAYFK